MGCKASFTLLRCFIGVSLISLSNGLRTSLNGFTPISMRVPWTVHGTWGQSRSLQVKTHFSCDFEVPEVINHYFLDLNSSSELLDGLRTWGLEELSRGDELLAYQNTKPIYPPRVSLQFHVVSKYALKDLVQGTCTLSSAPFRFEPITTIPSVSGSFAWEVDSNTVNPCKELSAVFPPLYIEGHQPPPEPYQPPDTDEFPGWDVLWSRSRNERALPNRGPHTGLLLPTETYDYIKAIVLSMKFFGAQRSGPLKSLRDISWVKSSGMFHSAPDGSDLTGGWYNGNDNVKLSFPMASATTLLAWGFQTWGHVYNENGFDQNMKDILKWSLDYFLKSWKPDEEKLYVQVGDLNLERTLFEKADNSKYLELWTTGQWPVYKVDATHPGSDVAAEIATAMAIASQLNIFSGFELLPVYPFNGCTFEKMKTMTKLHATDQAYSNKLLETATQLYNFAKKYRGKYSDHVPVGGHGHPDYTSSDFYDELCLAAMTLKDVSPGGGYLKQGKRFFDESISDNTTFNWNNKRVACAIKLYKELQLDEYKEIIEQFRQYWMDPFTEITPYGLPWKTENGTLSNTANAVFILLQAIEASVFDDDYLLEETRAWCVRQINYMLGRNSMKRSYQIGYPTGTSSDIVNPYHKNSACPNLPGECGQTFEESVNNNTNILVGALVGGPDLNDYHNDARYNHLGNSVAVDYNAGFQSALVGIQSMYDDLMFICNNGATPPSTTYSSTYPSTYSSTYSSTYTASGVTSPTPYNALLPTDAAPRPTSFNYKSALRSSIKFYAAQKSSLNEPSNNPIKWRLWGGSEFEGGWYDDGTSIRTTKLMAGSTYILGWGMLAFKQGYELAGILDDAYDQMHWALTFLNKLYNPSSNTLIRKVGNEIQERALWSRPSDYLSKTSIDDIQYISLQIAGADVAADVVTALSVGSVLFKEKNASFSETLKSTAIKVYTIATQLSTTYRDEASKYYSEPGDNYDDEMCVATWWLFKATDDISYYPTGMNYRDTEMSSNVLDWKDKQSLCLLLLYEQTGDARLSNLLTKSMTYWEGSKDGVHYTPQGLAWHDTEPLKYAANAAFIQVLARTFGVSTIQGKPEFSKTQIDYMLGNNDKAYSYQVGYGDRYPLRVHHRASSCANSIDICDWTVYNRPGRNPYVLIGALVAGPDKNDVFEDVRVNYTMNRVSIEANAGFQSVLAYLVQTHQAPVTSTSPPPTTTKTTTVQTTNKQTTLKPSTTTTEKRTTPTKKPTAKPTTTKEVLKTTTVAPATAGVTSEKHSMTKLSPQPPKPQETPLNNIDQNPDPGVSAATSIKMSTIFVLSYVCIIFTYLL